MMHYKYTHAQTEATTGYFSCEPHPPLSLDAALAHLAKCPLDDYMRRHLLTRMQAMPPQELPSAFARACPSLSLPPPLHALARELILLHPSLAPLLEIFVPGSLQTDGNATQIRGCRGAVPPAGCGQSPHPDKMASTTISPESPNEPATPLILLRWQRLPDRDLHRAWGAVFADNIQRHRALQTPEATGLEPLYRMQDGVPVNLVEGAPELSPAFTRPFVRTVAEVRKDLAQGSAAQPHTRLPAEEVAALAEERLTALGIIAGKEMRHTASLSPIALLRPWNIALQVTQGRHRHTLEGQATTYGRGLALADARASCLMEMAERASAYLSVSDDCVENRAEETSILRGPRSQLLKAGHAALDPNDFSLETPYTDASLAWMPGHTPEGGTVYVPVQMASLFCNLDEISLFDSPGSTGIATGMTMEEAKVAALTEVFERDAEATTPFAKASCFTLRVDDADDALLAALLRDYAAQGINVQFQDLTGPMGLPVYKCFVMGLKGAIARGHGAGLSARRALVSALTETPFPYPGGGPSGPLLRKLPVKALGELPDSSLATPAQNLALLERTLAANGRSPVYVDLTRRDLGFPVVRALVPGMEPAADSDAFTRVPVRLYANYLNLFA